MYTLKGMNDLIYLIGYVSIHVYVLDLCMYVLITCIDSMFISIYNSLCFNALSFNCIYIDIYSCITNYML
jgi:hypothetical protein